MIKKRANKINHDFSVCAWICSLYPDIRADVKARLKGKYHEDRVNNFTKKLNAQILDVEIAEIQNKLWKEWKIFKNEDGVYENCNMWNMNDTRMGNSTEWHAMYFEVWTEVMGFIAPIVTSP